MCMKDTELAWVAGLLEGEGSFMKGAPSRPNKPVVSMESTDRDVVERVAALCGVRVSTIKQRNPEKWKPTYRMRLHGGRAVRLMELIRDQMSERRQAQIDEVLASYSVARRRVIEL